MMTLFNKRWLLLPAFTLWMVGITLAQPAGNVPGNSPGTDHDVIVTPGATPGTLSFTYSGCTSDCDQRPVKASSSRRRSTLSFKFRFANERIVMAQVTFPEGTPLFQERENSTGRKQKFYDAQGGSTRGQALGFAELKRPIKSLNWRRTEGITEIEDGDSFKYDVLVITEAGGQTKIYAADPIIIVRGMEVDELQ